MAEKMSPQQKSMGAQASATLERTYVLDTSVLLSDPKAIFRFAEHAVVLPVIVVTEREHIENAPEAKSESEANEQERCEGDERIKIAAYKRPDRPETELVEGVEVAEQHEGDDRGDGRRDGGPREREAHG